MTPKDFQDLTDVLAYLYDKKTAFERILVEVGIPLSEINLDDSSSDRWYSALKEAEKLGKVNSLLDGVKNGEYGANTRFQQVYQSYHQSIENDRQTDFISDKSTQEKFPILNQDETINSSSNKIENAQITKPDRDILGNPAWQFVSVIITLLMPLIQSDPRWYIPSAIVAFILSYLFSQRVRQTVNLAIIVYFVAVFFLNPTFFEIRLRLNHMILELGVPESSTNAANSKPTGQSESLIGQVAIVDPVTAWDRLCLRTVVGGGKIYPCMPPSETVTLLSNNNDGWVQVKDQSGRQGYTLLRYLLFTEVQDTYINLFWRHKNPGDKIDDGCITAPRLELLTVNQPEGFCDPNVRVMSLDKLEVALHKYGMLDVNESIHLWTVDNGASIIVKTDGNRESDFIKINKVYPKSSKDFLVGAIWREVPYPGTPIRMICWLKTNGELVCDPIP